LITSTPTPKPARIAMASGLLIFLFLSATPVSADAQDTLRQVQLLIAQPDHLSPAEQAQRAIVALADLRADPALAGDAWLTAPLTDTPPDLVQANARTTAALAALVDTPRQPPNPAALAALTAVLAEPRFHPTDLLSALPAWLRPVAQAVAAVANVVAGILHWLLDQFLAPLLFLVRSPAFGPAMVALAAAVTVGVFLLYRHGLRAAMVAQAELTSTAGALPLTAAEAVAATRAWAAQGRYRDACHYLLFSVLLWIEEQQGVRFDRSATNREHLRRLAAAAPEPRTALVGAMEPVVQRFDRLWYGQTTVTAADYAELDALAARVREAAT